MKIDWSQDRNNSRRTFGKRFDVILFTATVEGSLVRLTTNLPGLKIKMPLYPSIDRAKVAAELMGDTWLDMCQLITIPDPIDPFDLHQDSNNLTIIPKA